jgi:hypothetical protein
MNAGRERNGEMERQRGCVASKTGAPCGPLGYFGEYLLSKQVSLVQLPLVDGDRTTCGRALSENSR